MRKIYTLVIALVVAMPSFSQFSEKCAAAYVMKQEMENNPEYRQVQEELERFTEKYVATHQVGEKTLLLTIPVVVHIIYKTSAQNIPDSKVHDAITVLNEDFRKKFGTPGYNGTNPVAADVEIEFALAKQDPAGDSTTGITRTATSVSSFDPTGNAMKFNSSGGRNIWDRNSYLNIWVCVIATDAGGVVGRAEFPGAAANIDGIIVDYRWFGAGERTTTHEVGHWLNLRHIWGDGICATDFVSDTPTHLTANSECINHPAVCTFGIGVNENIQNYMDYTPSSCQNMFTTGQKNRMHACINSTRSSLKTSNGLTYPSSITTGISRNTVSSMRVYYPNPSRGVVNIELAQGLQSGIIHIDVINAFGQLVRSFDTQADGSRITFDLSGMETDGLYQIHVTGEQLNLNFSQWIKR